jgi:hypothetical protein
MKNDPQIPMSMLQYPLYDFLATVPSCLETSTLAVVLEIFEKEQCDRLVVVNQQQSPIGLLYSARLIQKLLADDGDTFLNLQHSLSTFGQTLIDPIQTIPASKHVEQLSWWLRYQQAQKHQNLDLALIDSDGKFLGLIDSLRLLQLLIKERVAGSFTLGSTAQRVSQGTPQEYDPSVTTQSSAPTQNERKPLVHKSLVQLLERLPWPLMLQTGTGEVVAQNPAWWQQLGVLKDPEGVKQQVEAILAPVRVNKPEYATQKAVKVHPNGRGNDLDDQGQPTSNKHLSEEHTLSFQGEAMPQPGLPMSESQNQEQQAVVETPSSRCFLDSQVGTCTCVVEVQNGQERIWQFAKIPLDSPELKVLNTES